VEQYSWPKQAKALKTTLRALFLPYDRQYGSLPRSGRWRTLRLSTPRRSLALVSKAVMIDADAAVRRHELHGSAATAKIGVDVFPADLSAIKRNVD
jgi:hypothetical protein